MSSCLQVEEYAGELWRERAVIMSSCQQVKEYAGEL